MGLGQFTVFEICKQNLNILNEILNYLKRLEDMIFARVETKDKNNEQKFFHQKRDNFKNNKWCIYHRTKSYSNEQCYKNQRSRFRENTDYKNKNEFKNNDNFKNNDKKMTS
ncbi:hypothetical protein DMUE_1376 [Dictyocoela muelleri]|nr:hypothetical protein DMUE_1376 [Dictyocoela muelleri]